MGGYIPRRDYSTREAGCQEPTDRISRRNQLRAVPSQHYEGINRTGFAGLNQLISRDGFRHNEHGNIVVIECERRARFADTVTETDAQGPVDPDREAVYHAFELVRHYMSSRPRSTRASSITAGVISPIPRFVAQSE